MDVDVDAAGLREVLSICDDVLICSSYSKNFGLYRERAGALTVVAHDASQAAAVQSQVKTAIRRNYSNPPAHGALVVEHILSDADLTKQWLDELSQMRGRINGMRTARVRPLTVERSSLTPTATASLSSRTACLPCPA